MALDVKPWKKHVNNMVDVTFIRIKEEQEEEKTKENKQEEECEEDVEEEGEDSGADSQPKQESVQSPIVKAPRKLHKKARNTVSATDDEHDSNEESKLVESQTTKKSSERQRKKHSGSPVGREKHVEEDSDSDLEPSEQKVKRPSQETSRKKDDAGKKKGSVDEETIKRLKSYVNKCGVRKVWAKELKDCKTLKAQINTLKSMLEDLGVHGRPTIEKCQKVKAEKELKAEIDSLDTGNILDDKKIGRSTRSTGSKRKRKVIADEDEEEYETADVKKRKSVNSEEEEDGDDTMDAQLDVSFLGDQSSDSE
ncbi:hypothetical protein DFQ28_011516 [Apophysomyces sp. BC1034]|nr:hypothetical protein DFQ30_007008 [Apophysomyces sp. BC1015]KAG0176305.1 hypothetical protein DFQ29_006309 [Apophysomyces sp. BC1021]KAG0184250.1 hypothetical protein DFQ28_011516 [Apophysomyces sp. BC1034]